MKPITDRNMKYYFYASDTVEYYATFDPENDRIGQRFHGPYDDKQEAREAYYEWLEDERRRQEEPEVEYAE